MMLNSQEINDNAALADLCAGTRPQAVYLHVPLCFHKCHYCDFYSIVETPGVNDRQAAFTDRLIDEIQTLGRRWRDAAALRSVFVGGGTPTLLRIELWRKLLAALHGAFDLDEGIEFTVEANPETLTAPLVETLAAGGVNRLSIGAQSFNLGHLKTLERWHDPANVARAVKLAHAAGIDDVNLDLIFAIPGQTRQQWRDDLRQALALRPTHLSCYALTYEPNTPMTTQLKRGRIERCDEATEAAMYETALETLIAAGFEHYEISNFAVTPEHRCRHNLAYWRNEDWLAMGPSASGHLAGLRWKNVPHLGRYLATTGGSPVQEVEQLGDHTAAGEWLMMGLRLIEGVPRQRAEGLLDTARLAVIDRFVGEGLLERTATQLHFTRRGLLFADCVLSELV